MFHSMFMRNVLVQKRCFRKTTYAIGETHVIRPILNAFHPSLHPFGRLSKEFKALLIQFRI